MSSKIATLRPSGDELSPPPKVLELLNKAYIDLSKIKLEGTNMTTNNKTTTPKEEKVKQHNCFTQVQQHSIRLLYRINYRLGF